MDRHLNIFKFFSQNQSKENIEDNLSRALVLCLKNNMLFFHEFLQHILNTKQGREDYNYLFSNYLDQDTLDLDIQINVNNLNEENYKRIYAIAVTETDVNLDDFFSLKLNASNDYKPITDILITINDILFVFEVKRTNENCKQQLYNQIHQLTNNNVAQGTVVPFSFNWKEILNLVTKVVNFQKMNAKPDIFLEDFIGLVSQYNINWLPLSPFASLLEVNNNELNAKRYQRLNAAINNAQKLNLVPLNYNDRIGFNVDFNWATEIIPWFERDEKNGPLFLNVYIWPGNTKGQGFKVFGSSKLDAMLKIKTLNIFNQEFEVKIDYNLKFSHFNKFITELEFSDNETFNKIVSTKNFENYAGKHNREEWFKLESFFDAHFTKQYNWRKKCKWEEKFLETNRNYLTLSIGYQIKTKIPYIYLQDLDKNENDLNKITEVLHQVYLKYQDLL